MKRTFITLTLILWVFVAGFSQITDPFFEKVTYIGAFGHTDWTQGWANWTPQTTVYPATTVTVGDGTTLPSETSTNTITTNTHWSSSNSPVIGNASFSNSNLADPFFEQVNFVGAFGTYDWTQGWSNFDPQNTVYPVTNVLYPVPARESVTILSGHPIDPSDIEIFILTSTGREMFRFMVSFLGNGSILQVHHSISTRMSFCITVSPGLTLSVRTMPSFSESTLFSIFMASIVRSF